MRRKAMAKYAALAIAYAASGKLNQAGYFGRLWLTELGVTADNLQNGEAPEKFKGYTWNDNTMEYEPGDAKGTVTLIRNGQKVGSP